MPPHPSPEELALIDPDGTFRTRLRDDRGRIAAALAERDLDALEVLAHRLAGAAGTFGFAEVSDRAIALEDMLLARREGGAAGRMEPTAATAALLQALDRT